MEEENTTLLTEFVLTGLTDQQGLQVPLFLLFLMIYLITIVGNLGLIALIWSDPQLHIPMYFFLGSLAFVDAWISSAVTPNMLFDLLSMNKMISLSECMIQFFAFAFGGTTECFLLGTMAYDRYVAICKPLLYPVIVTNRLCIRLLVSVFVGGFLHSLFHVLFLLRLTFCNSNIIHHFYCDIIPLYNISCTDPTLNLLLCYIISMSIQVFTISTVFVSYFYILFTIFKIESKDGRGKALSTCASHFFSVSIFYACLLMHIAPSEDSNKDILVAVLYTIIIPFLNPFIYRLRNMYVVNAVKKDLKTYNIF
ncbi:olfactory receptor 186 isoform X2 [Mastomys coucha]|uniref:olfactory receptor 186 isoform X2 n=1 Tax=Mastomys coucha TaxID=35658 RepID=UPI001261F128|nr:olfactory receptor 186 isoform X2 [Mastomys coucha]